LDFPKAAEERVLDHLAFLYGCERADPIWQELSIILEEFRSRNPDLTAELDAEPLSEKDAILITYGDQFRERNRTPLSTLRDVLCHALDRPVSAVHLLPFYPYSSDDGFSVIDYAQVDPALGTWDDIEALGADFRLMFDAVINHISRHSSWFQAYVDQDPDYLDWFITVEPDTDLSQVVRPRALPLLTPIDTAKGQKWVWTTFSDDQIDLNYAHPPTLLKIVEILLLYIEKGARLLRLDAIAYLWKVPGTSSIHLEQTHRVVKLLRCVLDIVAPHVLLITETNVPHKDNISYFGSVREGSGQTDEAQLVYQFPLAPLVMHSLLSGNAETLSRWAATLATPSPFASFFNFTASHDGIGVLPAHGLLSEAETQALVDATLEHGGLVSYRHNPDGSKSVYELNISYFDALSSPNAGDPLAVQVARFIASQAIMLALKGVPGIYVHSLLGSRSWHDGVAQTGRNRTINRQKLDRQALDSELADPASLRHQVFAAYRRLLEARTSDRAFHPQGQQAVLDLDSRLFVLLRQSPEKDSTVLCLHNVTEEALSVRLAPLELSLPPGPWRDTLAGETFKIPPEGFQVPMPPYGVRWLKDAS
jgi:sucrose phosphorylase